MLESIKKLVFWDYARGTWQYDVLCGLIIAFIFLTPLSWFENRSKLAGSRTLIVSAENFSTDKAALKQKIHDLAGISDAEILDWRERRGDDGKTFYEVDIR